MEIRRGMISSKRETG